LFFFRGGFSFIKKATQNPQRSTLFGAAVLPNRKSVATRFRSNILPDKKLLKKKAISTGPDLDPLSIIM